jgi:hypothetical protein
VLAVHGLSFKLDGRASDGTNLNHQVQVKKVGLDTALFQGTGLI